MLCFRYLAVNLPISRACAQWHFLADRYLKAKGEFEVDKSCKWREVVFGDISLLVILALVKLLLHTLTNNQYGFHRDELATIDDARYLAWGYVAYPPVTPFIARIALELFGPSLNGLRFFAALSQSIAMVLAGLIARELGGKRQAQLLAAAATAIATISLAMSTLFQYVAFDYLWWVLIAYWVIRLLKSNDPRWWLGIGAVIGLGMMTKYTMAFYVVGIIVGVLITRERRYLKSPWLWAGVALSLLVFLPNLIWQAQHNFISLQFLVSIHARDVRVGRAADFLLDQVRLSANPFTIPLWIAGLYYYFVPPIGRGYRMIGWMAVVPVILFGLAQGRGYYTGPVFPMLLAGGAVVWEQWVSKLSLVRARATQGIMWSLVALGGVIVLLLGPYSQVNSPLWNVASEINTDMKEEIGWQELVKTVSTIYTSLPEAERQHASILAGNYGEAGAIDLYGPNYGLPPAISGVDSYWWRGYGSPPPETLIVVGFNRTAVDRLFQQCELAGHVSNRFGVRNEETIYHPDIFICREPREPWPQLWEQLQSFA